ncbi:ATP-binding cassette domain-containing protein [Cellulomonas sp. C5510]|uniref:ATP-binding cassette domain-containing protein n=1 Tax=Cellulomonas sp. C5510 TaxID=2871170 RepID=UPI002106C8A3|nr:ATP-binding cassette domain-containing protein [Cellulomonas sp. C5510]
MTGYGVEGLTVHRGGRAALADVTLPVPAGEVTAVVGGDGAGKTTLARVLVGREVPVSGRVRRADRRRTGFLPATSGVWGDLSVAENVELVARAYGLDPATARVRAEELLAAAALDGVQDRLGRQLSGGMRQKLGFCLAMLHRPDLVVLDEPSTGVDPVSRVELWRLLSTAAAGGTAVLVTTTYLDEAERAASVLVLDRGTEVYRGDPARAADRVRGSVLVSSAGQARPAVGGTDGALAVWRRGRARHALVPAGAGGPPPDLEDAVIALTLERRGPSEPPTATGPAPGEPSARATTPGRVPAAVREGDAASRRAVPGPDPAPAVEAAHVVTTFGGLRAVDDVSLTVRPGEVVGLLGANGAGKTTVIRTVLGLLAPTSGAVRVLGGAPSREVRRRIGYVPQGLGLAADLTVAENLAFVASAYGLRDVPALPADLAAVADRLVGGLSLGLQRRLAFAAALSHAPELLVLDEPTSGVDPLARAALWDTVHAQAEAGVAVLVTTHYMQEAEQCDALVLMAHGRRVAAGTLPEVLDGSAAVEVVGADWQAAFAALGAAGLPVTVAGRAVRVAGAAPREVERALASAGVAGRVRSVPARLEEVLVLADGRP